MGTVAHIPRFVAKKVQVMKSTICSIVLKGMRQIVHHVELCLSDAPKVEPNSGEGVGAPCVPAVPCPKCSCGAKQEGATRQKSRYYTTLVSGTHHM